MNKRAPRSSVDDPRKQLTEAARKERKRFLEVYSRHLEQIRQISLNVLVLGKNPSTTSPIANIRKEIVQVLRERGDNAMFSDDPQIQGHRIKIGGLGRMANSAFGGKLNLCGTSSYLFTRFVVALVVDNKYNVYVR